MNLVEKTAAIMFLGTPHRGSKSAWLGTQAAILLYFFGKDSNIDVIKATQYDSLELQDMHRNFEKVSGSIDILNLYEKRKLTRFRMKEHVSPRLPIFYSLEPNGSLGCFGAIRRFGSIKRREFGSRYGPCWVEQV